MTMTAFTYILFLTAGALFVTAASIVLYDLWFGCNSRRTARAVEETAEPESTRWRTTVAFAALAWIPLLITIAFIHAAARVLA
jgi:hypothetical protein